MIYSFHNTSFRDQQTGLYNEAYFMEVFYREWHRVIRENKALSILYIQPKLNLHSSNDIEEFQQLAKLLENSTYRATDLVSRFNHSRFIIGLFDLAPEGALVVIERIIQNLKAAEAQLRETVNNTFIGALHVLPDHQLNINEVFDQVLGIEPLPSEQAQFRLIEYRHGQGYV